MLASGIGGMVALGMLIQTKVSKTMSTVSSARYSARSSVTVKGRTIPATPTTTETTFLVGPRGLETARRDMVIEQFARAQALSPVQRERLDQLLAKAGKEIFPFGLSEQTLKSAVNEAGTLSGSGSIGNYYMLGSGKIEVYDDRAIFSPTDGQPVRANADDPVAADDQGNALPKRTIDALLQSAQQQSGNKLTPQQLTTLQTDLSDPRQTLVLPDGAGTRISATILPDGSARVTGGNGFVEIDPAGRVIRSTGMMMTTMSRFAVRGTTSAMTLLDALLSGALAIYLLVVGILVLRQHRRGRAMLRAFAIVKIPIAVLGAIGWVWTIEDANAGAVSAGWLQFWLWTLLAIGLIYPIALLIVLSTRTVREYYSKVG
jgi:hypothetical protein